MKTAATAARDRSTVLLVSALAAKEIGARIAQARRESGMTQDEVSEASTFSRRSLQMWESGASIPYRQMRELSELLDRPVAWLLHGEREESEDAQELIGSHLEDIEEKLDRLTVIVEALAESRAEARGDPDGHRSVGNDS